MDNTWSSLRLRSEQTLPTFQDASSLNAPRNSPLEDLIRGEEYDYPISDLYDEDVLSNFYPSATADDISESAHRRTDYGELQKMLPLMDLAKKDKVDLYIPPDDELDALYEAMKTLRKNYE